MRSDVLGLDEVDRTDVDLVGGKGANLGELSTLEGIRVPEGFCVSTAVFERVVGDEQDREIIEGIPLPEDLREEIARFLVRLGEHGVYAVRSSATAEDLPSASFAGLHDSYLNVTGIQAVLEHIRRCWASLFTGRAVAYRLQHGMEHRKVRMAVVVQRMLVPQAAGVLFTADPVTGNRKVVSIEAVPGLGETMVSGRVNADGYQVRDGRIVEKRSIARTLEDPQIVELAQLGRRIEAHFGEAQDIEWCLAEHGFHFVQSRPITTLFPVPEGGEPGNRVYISVGHQQMMTDPMKPLGLSLFRMTAGRPMYAAGGRLFVDPTDQLAVPASRDLLLGGLLRTEPLIRDALMTVLDRDDFIEKASGTTSVTPPARAPAPDEDDPAIVADLIARGQASIEALGREIRSKTGTELLDFIQEDVQHLKKSLTEPRNFGAIMAGMNAVTWIHEQMLAWLGEKNAADTLSQSVPGNVTSEMGLALLDVADAIRPHPEVIAYLEHAKDEGFLEELLPLAGGREAREALASFLARYGMRCTGEIDVTRTRWSEAPTILVPLILANVRNFEPGSGRRRFEEGRLQAWKKEQEILERLKRLPDGGQKAAETERMIRRLRSFIGYREYPKYGIVSRYALYRRALLEEARRLVQAQVIREPEDIYFLSFQELCEVVRTRTSDAELIRMRKAAHVRHAKLTPPRVLTSDGEIVAGSYRRGDLPSGALVGLAASAGVVEGRARVLVEMCDAGLEAGDILVTAFTDPSWTPLFLSIKGLVTEVGGLMTHGVVIAREYGLPAVVGVENATRSIQDGQRIRVNGTDGYVEILDRELRAE